ncbi:hypothetical protein SEVIR_7G000500v4 [Setaria viridis]|uniref:F-box domain-containing protein n=2 Tax=Setaria TaxID=4554 RepID=K3Y7T3_SETIT|nr:uncharacterized protein LOC101767920 [Setaria italica]XP_004975044.1 uncharacterized protein LOC101767920 [Setaria italica]XP_034604473.1 uncharacterized protein LOC117864466 isoform X2 [Setaria viridis]RCV32621.1 hypothetical protein SETIT_7G017600v2 [Setaria italica]TKW03096.1 hypothetical protein SEVIR_7G000500v2 [Setaria viridis]
MSEGLMSRRPSSPPPAAALLPDNDDILREILLRLPPLPSSLPRASLVCKHWRRLLSDPRFLRRFRAFHRRNPPLLGIFNTAFYGLLQFTPTLDPPDRIPSARLSLQVGHGDEIWDFLGCRHGLALILNQTRLELTVWDPLAGDQRRVPVPPGWFRNEGAVYNAALICNNHLAGGVPLEAFKVVLLRGLLDADHPQLFASIYESETGVWGDAISIAIGVPVTLVNPSVLTKDSLCWLVQEYDTGSDGNHILEFDLDRQALAVFGAPVGTEESCLELVRMEDNKLGLAALLDDVTIQLWERKAGSDGVARWMLQKSIKLDKLLSVGSPIVGTLIHGYDENGHVIFISTSLDVFMIQLKTMQFRHLFKAMFITSYHPYTGFYTTGRGIGSGDVGAESLNST